ncbi:MlaD family protein [Paenirhodobacter populi]|uniref:MCE family protein n=1 Tax=Paenirhodobacter populi TaxID=2306993 RepID=A0A443J6E9_9RHOB|nr:MlaD family protein [Sinirhodobacter populi]RWR15963.1 MCE family protein [Sinirhodobacter populi]
METKANYTLIGAFTIAGFVGILAFLIWFAKLQVNRQFAYYDIYFPEVSGLNVSSSVTFAGLPVGKVINMRMADRGDGSVQVRIEVQEDTPVRTDSAAALMPQGVTGINIVAISAGSAAAPLLRTASGDSVPVIPARATVLQSLSSHGPEMIERLNMVSEQLTQLLGEENQNRVSRILDNVERSSAHLDQALTDIAQATDAVSSTVTAFSGFGGKLDGLGESAGQTLASADTALKKFTETATNLDGLIETGNRAAAGIGDYVSGDLAALTARLDTTAAALGDTVPDTARQARDTLAAAQRTFDGVSGVIDTDVGPVVRDLRQTLGSLDTALARVSDDLPEIMSQLRGAADSAQGAFASLRGMIDGARTPVEAFTRNGLPQFTRAASGMQGLIANMDQLVTTLRRNPSQLLSGQKVPEFRR